MKLRNLMRYKWICASMAGTAIAVAAPGARAQNNNSSWWDNNSIGSNYRVGQNSGGVNSPVEVQPVTSYAPEAASSGPVRMARFLRADGNVTWRPLTGGTWSTATVNLPLRQGAQVWVTNGGRADLQFDDGTELRIGNGGLVTLKTMYSDSQGEYTRITLRDGVTTLRLVHNNSI